jgi:hypothetical protein
MRSKCQVVPDIVKISARGLNDRTLKVGGDEIHSFSFCFERIADAAALVRASDLLGGVKAFRPKLGLDHKNKTQKEIDHEY